MNPEQENTLDETPQTPQPREEDKVQQDDQANQVDPRATSIGVGIALGVALGSGIGLAMDNLAIGIAIGMSTGVALGATGVFGKTG